MTQKILSKISAAALAVCMLGGICTQSIAQTAPLYETITAQDYSAGKVSISTLSFSKISAQVYTGKQIKPKITVKNGSKTLTKGKDYSVTYKNNMNIGTATLTVKGLGNYTGTKKISFKIKPGTPKVTISKQGSVTKLSWGKVRGAGGYQIYYSQNGEDYTMLATTSSTKYSIPALSGGDKCSYKVRAYKKVSGKSVYGSFSKAVTLAPAGTISDDGNEFTVVTLATSYDSLIKNFAQENNINVNIVDLNYDQRESAEDYYDYIKTARDADILIIDGDLIYDVINDGRICVPLSEVGLSESDFPQAFDYTLTFGTNDKGEFSALSIAPSPGGFMYRTDLAKKYLGVNSPEEMQKLIKDWDSFTKTAKTLYNKSNGKTALLDSVFVGAFYALLQSDSESWVKNGKLNTAKAERIIDYAYTLISNGYATDAQPWDDEWFSVISEGKALGEFLPSWAFYDSDYSVAAQMAGGYEVALCEGPSAFYWGGSYVCVSATCDNAALAKKFVDYCGNDSDALNKCMVTYGDFVNNEKVMSDANYSLSILGRQNPFDVLVEAAKDIDGDYNFTKYDASLNSCLSLALYELCVNGIDSDKALEEFKYYVEEYLPELKIG